MKGILFMLVLLLASCGKEYVGVPIPGPTVEVPGPTTEVPVEQLLEGYYYLDNNSSIELTASEDGDITIESVNQFMFSVNPDDDTIGQHPLITGKYEVHNSKIRIVKNLNYSGNYDQLEEDNGGSISGSIQTIITIEPTDDGIKITIVIYDDVMGETNEIVATRVFTSI